MTKNDYMYTLSSHLRGLPKEDYKETMSYYEEYFQDSGIGPTDSVDGLIESPEKVAKELIAQCAEKSVVTQPQTIKKSFSTVWIVLLSILASPIALPIAIVIITLLFTIVITVVAFLFSFFVTGIALICSGVMVAIGSVFAIFSQPISFVFMLGAGLFLLGLGILIFFGTFQLTKVTLFGISKIFYQLSKGGKKNA